MRPELAHAESFKSKSLQPEPGFYKHYKHAPSGAPLNYFYEVIGVAKDTEDECMHVIYRPLYESEFLGEAQFFSRPLAMFVEEVEVSGQRVPRFERITDPETLDFIRSAIRSGKEIS